MDAFNRKDYDATRRAWKQFQPKHPPDMRNPEIMFMLGFIEYELNHHDAAKDGQIAFCRGTKLLAKKPPTKAIKVGRMRKRFGEHALENISVQNIYVQRGRANELRQQMRRAIGGYGGFGGLGGFGVSASAAY